MRYRPFRYNKPRNPARQHFALEIHRALVNACITVVTYKGRPKRVERLRANYGALAH